MKGWIVAAVLMALMVVAVGINSAYVRRVSEEMQTALAALPQEETIAETDPDALVADVRAMRDIFEKRTSVLSLTVPTSDLAEIRRCLSILESYARRGALNEFCVTRRELEDLARQLADTEGGSWRSLV